jgi:hypothetical protein
MSIATLKRKSLTQYGTDHCNAKGQFSLNGVYRQLPYTLGRSVMGTPFRGPYPMGHGQGSRCRVSGWRARATGNSYPVIVSNSGSCIVPQTEIKRSTMNNWGMIETRYKGILHASPSNVYRVDKDQGTYISKQTSQSSFPNTIVQTGYVVSPSCTQANETSNTVSKVYSENTPRKCTPYTKNETRLTYCQYNSQLVRQCVPIVSPYKGINSCSPAMNGGSNIDKKVYNQPI